MYNEVIIQSPKASSILYYNSLYSNGENDVAWRDWKYVAVNTSNYLFFPLDVLR